MSPDTFLTRWAGASGTELANAQSFVGELAELLGFPRPHPAQEDTRENAYVFERRVIFKHGDGSSSEGRIDCYKRDCFVLEAKKLKVPTAPQVGAGETALNPKQRRIYELGLVGVLAQLHAELDAEVYRAYGWNDTPSDEQILDRLVALNIERRNEEAQGHIRWLRPEFQAPESTQTVMAGVGVPRATICDNHEESGAPSLPAAPTVAISKQDWPGKLPEQMQALAATLTPQAQTEDQIAARFTGKGKWESRLPDLLATLAALGRARCLDDGRWLG